MSAELLVVIALFVLMVVLVQVTRPVKKEKYKSQDLPPAWQYMNNVVV